MATNKHAIIRYQALDKCFSNFGRQFFIDDLIEACNDALYQYTGDEKYSDSIAPGISRRQIFDDIAFMESDAGYQAYSDTELVAKVEVSGKKYVVEQLANESIVVSATVDSGT